MLRPLHTTVAYKGCRFPAIRWTGDPDVVARTEELYSHVSMARDAHNMREKADRERSLVAYVDAAAALQAFCLEMGLSPKEAERAMFTARLQADVAADELDTVSRAKNGEG